MRYLDSLSQIHLYLILRNIASRFHGTSISCKSRYLPSNFILVEFLAFHFNNCLELGLNKIEFEIYFPRLKCIECLEYKAKSGLLLVPCSWLSFLAQWLFRRENESTGDWGHCYIMISVLNVVVVGARPTTRVSSKLISMVKDGRGTELYNILHLSDHSKDLQSQYILCQLVIFRKNLIMSPYIYIYILPLSRIWTNLEKSDYSLTALSFMLQRT